MGPMGQCGPWANLRHGLYFLLALLWLYSVLALLLPYCHRPAVDPLWTRCGPAVDLLWTRCGPAVDLL